MNNLVRRLPELLSKPSAGQQLYSKKDIFVVVPKSPRTSITIDSYMKTIVHFVRLESIFFPESVVITSYYVMNYNIVT